MADGMITPDEWAPPLPEGPHDHKGHSEEKCVRCGWVMGNRPLNCLNDDTPHVFPSQQAEIKRLRAAGDKLAQGVLDAHQPFPNDEHIDLWWMVVNWEEARRG